MYRIGEFSKLSKTTIKTLRYYDEIGLLKPEQTDRFTGYRMYTTDQLVKLHEIQALRQAGLTPDEAADVLAGRNVTEILERRRAELESEFEDARARLARLNFILSGREEKEMENYKATIKQVKECIIYAVKTVIPSYEAYFELLPAIGEKVAAKYPEIKCVTPEYCFVRYLDGEYREKDISIEYCEAVDRLEPDFDDVTFRKLPAATVVSVMHKGSYATLTKAYSYAAKWIEENGYRMTDAPRESYIDGVWNKDSEDEWLTELQFPIAQK